MYRALVNTLKRAIAVGALAVVALLHAPDRAVAKNTRSCDAMVYVDVGPSCDHKGRCSKESRLEIESYKARGFCGGLLTAARCRARARDAALLCAQNHWTMRDRGDRPESCANNAVSKYRLKDIDCGALEKMCQIVKRRGHASKMKSILKGSVHVFARGDEGCALNEKLGEMRVYKPCQAAAAYCQCKKCFRPK